jgi:hypothetical protein
MSAKRATTLAEVDVGHYVTMSDGSVVRLAAVINGATFVRGGAGAGALEERPRSTPILDSGAPAARAADTAPVHDPLAGASDRGLPLFTTEDA